MICELHICGCCAGALAGEETARRRRATDDAAKTCAADAQDVRGLRGLRAAPQREWASAQTDRQGSTSRPRSPSQSTHADAQRPTRDVRGRTRRRRTARKKRHPACAATSQRLRHIPPSSYSGERAPVRYRFGSSDLVLIRDAVSQGPTVRAVGSNQKHIGRRAAQPRRTRRKSAQVFPICGWRLRIINSSPDAAALLGQRTKAAEIKKE